MKTFDQHQAGWVSAFGFLYKTLNVLRKAQKKHPKLVTDSFILDSLEKLASSNIKKG